MTLKSPRPTTNGILNIIEQFEKILTNKDASFEEITYQICDCLGENMEKHLDDIQKINFDFGVLAINEPERAAKIMAGIKAPGNLDYLGKKAIPMLIEGAYKTGYHPTAKPEDIGLFISASYSEYFSPFPHGTSPLSVS